MTKPGPLLARGVSPHTTMKMTHVALLACPAAMILASTGYSIARGALPGTVGLLLTGQSQTVANTVVRSGQGCAQCHPATAGAPLPVPASTPDRYSLDLNQSIQITTSATGGVVNPNNHGGFVMETTRGAFTPAQTTSISTDGKFIAQSFSFWGRSWQYGYTAPATPGPVELYYAVQTADGDGNEIGDSWVFNGGDRQTSVPMRLFVNAPGVAHAGDGCVGAFGITPVLGGSTSATPGATLNLDIVGAAPSTTATFLFGASATQFPLATIGAAGCTLWVTPLFDITLLTSAGTPKLGDGTVSFPLPVPNNANLTGLTLFAQTAIADLGNGRTLPITMTNAVSFTVQ